MKFNQNFDKDLILVAIVIPTKNRANYAIHTIKACLNLGQPCEIIVVDNSSNDELESNPLILLHKDKLNYIRIRESHSVVDNFNIAINAATAPYITCIGDDDLVTSAIFDVARYALINKIEAVNFSFPITYWWPDFRHRRRGDIDAGKLLVEVYSGIVSKLDPIKELEKAMFKLGTGPLNMPKAYTGLVSRELVQRTSQKYGNLFGGVSPDVYSSTLLAYECKNFVHIDYPVIVPGLSGGSTSGASSNGKHIGKLSEHEHITAFKNLKWDVRVPDFYSVPTVWGYSMLVALSILNLDVKANLFSLYAKCFIYHKAYFASTKTACLQALKNQDILTVMNLSIRSVVSEALFILSAIYKRSRESFKTKKTLRLSNINNSEIASCHIELEITTRLQTYSWQKVTQKDNG